MTIQPGTRLGSYEITASIGAGGMGEVYRARDTRLDRDVAIKVLPEAMANDPVSLERFSREARAVAALNHPHIVTIFSTEEADGVRFMTMELIEGRTLNQMIPTGGLSLGQFFDIAIALADALSAAHQKQITHRDLKPANVMVSDDGRVKVLDFGLARVVEAEHVRDRDEEETRLKLTQAGTIVGTVPWMSPEQIEAEPLDHRTDIFSMGTILYEMTTGLRPFRGDSSAALMASIMKDHPKPVVELRPDVPAEVSLLIARCLEKQPCARVQNAIEILAELKAQRRVWESGSGGAALKAANLAPLDRRGASIAVMPFTDMSATKDQDWFCEGMAEEIMNALVGIDGIRVASRTSAFQARRQEVDLPAIGRLLSVEQILEGSVRTAGNRLRVTAQLIDVESGYQLWSERYDRNAEDVFAVQDEIAAGVVEVVKSRLAPGESVVRARPQVANLEAYSHYLKGRYLRYTKNDHGNALRSFEQAVALDASYAPSWVGLADVKALAAFYGLIPAREGVKAARAALEIAAGLQGESAEALYVEGMIAFGEWNWEASIRAVSRAVDLEPDHVRACCWTGIVLSCLGRVDEAMPVMQRAREVDPLAPYPHAMTGLSLLDAMRPTEAAPHFDNALALDAENSLALWGAGMVQVAMGRADEGIAKLERALTPSHRGGFIHGILGWALAVGGRKEEARVVLRDLRARPVPATAIVSEAWLLAALGETNAAWEGLERAERDGQLFLAQVGLPGFDSFRADARFAALLRRLRLPSVFQSRVESEESG